MFGGLLRTCVKLLHIIQLNIFFFATNTQQFNRIDNANFFYPIHLSAHVGVLILKKKNEKKMEKKMKKKNGKRKK